MRLAWAVVRAGQRGMDGWRRTRTCSGGDARRRRRRRGRQQLRQWRLGSPECLGWVGEGMGRRRRRRSPPPDTIQTKHTDTGQTRSYTHAHGVGGVCVRVGREVRWSMVRSSTFQTQSMIRKRGGGGGQKKHMPSLNKEKVFVIFVTS